MNEKEHEGGRNPDGTFAAGNPGGPGNPHAARVAQLRKALFDTVTEQDMQDVIRALVDAAKGGDIQAARILFDRILGKPLEADILERIEQLEQTIGDK